MFTIIGCGKSNTNDDNIKDGKVKKFQSTDEKMKSYLSSNIGGGPVKSVNITKL